MKKLTLLTFVLLVCFAGFVEAQIIWIEHTITRNFEFATSVYAIDLDDDGDVDVLGAASGADDITWWENDGSQNFTEHTISGDYDGAYDVYAADLDDDGDEDVLGAAFNDDDAVDITWWENDGSQNFTEHSISETFDGARSVYATDLDGDGNMDVLGAAYYDNEIAWWENDGNQNFTGHSIARGFNSAYDVYTTDIERDGDEDVLGAGNDGIIWWENDTSRNFPAHVIGEFEAGRSVHAYNIDGDQDIDVLGVADVGDDIIWWENDGDENFTEHNIADNYDGARCAYAVDLDRDNDVDVLGAAWHDAEITYWENDGDENFTEHTIKSGYRWAISVTAIDIDGDRDVDVLGVSNRDGIITWWENGGLSVTGDNNTILNEFYLSAAYPNPFNSSTTIRYNLPSPSNVSLAIYDPLGNSIVSLFKGYRQAGFHNINMTAADLSSGLYLVRLEAGGEVQTQKILLIK